MSASGPNVTARRPEISMTAGGLALIALSVLALDRPIATWAHSLHRPAWCVALTHIADLPEPVALAGLTVASVAFLCGWRPGAAGRVLLAAGIATLAAESAKDVLKIAFSRPWPETWINNNPSWIGTHTYGFFPFHGGYGWASFPSGHTTAISTPCAAVWPYARRLRPLLVLPPVLVAVGLIGADYHFLGDCVAGACLGVACGTAVPALICNARPAA